MASARGEGRHPAFVITLPMSPYCALGAIEGDGDLLLGGITGGDQQRHDMRRCRRRVMGGVAMHGKSGHNDETVLASGAQDEARFDIADPGWRRWRQGQFSLDGYTPVLQRSGRAWLKAGSIGCAAELRNWLKRRRKPDCREKSGQILVRPQPPRPIFSRASDPDVSSSGIVKISGFSSGLVMSGALNASGESAEIKRGALVLNSHDHSIGPGLPFTDAVRSQVSSVVYPLTFNTGRSPGECRSG